MLYTSADSHLIWLKIAHQCGLGRRAVRLIAVDAADRLDLAALAAEIEEDRRAARKNGFTTVTMPAFAAR